MVPKRFFSWLVCLCLLAACTHQELFDNKYVAEARVTDRTRAGDILAQLPLPAAKVPVVVYEFQDQTGQFKNNGAYTDYSSAVTKGGHAILTKALLDAGGKRWFMVAERGGLKNLLQERQIIKLMRGEYTVDGGKLPNLPPLIYGAVLIEGGIISYDSNIITGGVGAAYFGIGGSTQYHRDVVNVYLRAVSIKNGEVLLAVNSSKTVYSAAVNATVLRYLSFDKLLQAEAGFTVNEPTQLAVRQAIETAVYSLIMEGAIDGLWDFKSKKAGRKAVDEYIQRRDSAPSPDDIEAAIADLKKSEAAEPEAAAEEAPEKAEEVKLETKKEAAKAKPKQEETMAPEDALPAASETAAPSAPIEVKDETPGAKPKAYYIRVASFAEEKNARDLASESEDIGTVSVSKVENGNGTWWSVRLGPFSDEVAGEAALEKVRAAGASDARLYTR